MLDKNLFLYDLAIVAIIKNEAPYLREWLDYHLLAGIEHFYLYDNDSTDNQAEIVAPYVEAGLVDYLSASGEVMQMPAFNNAVKQFRYRCRYMAFIDADEFLYPKSNRSVAEVVAEILSRYPNAAGLAVNWQIFGSNGQQTADYFRGVLERFTRRAPTDWTPDGKGNAHVKTISNPRQIRCIYNPHCAEYFLGRNSVNENGQKIPGILIKAFNNPVTVNELALNHYYDKSREEFAKKIRRGRCDQATNSYDMTSFDMYDRNEIFDDGILRYRATREENFSLEDMTHRINRVVDALTENLSTACDLETTLTCRAISTYLREKFPHDADIWRICEETSLEAVLKSLKQMTLTDAQIFVRELPSLLNLPYPAVAEIRIAALQIIPQIIDIMKCNCIWQDYAELNYILDLLKLEADTFVKR